MSRLTLGIVCGLVYGALSAASMLPLTFENKTAALTGAFLNRFAIGLVIGAARLPGVQLSRNALGLSTQRTGVRPNRLRRRGIHSGLRRGRMDLLEVPRLGNFFRGEPNPTRGLSHLGHRAPQAPGSTRLRGRQIRPFSLKGEPEALMSRIRF